MAIIHDGVLDEGAKLQIVPNTRQITVPSSVSIVGTEGEHRSEQLTFQCPKIIDGHDVSVCASHYISWTNAAGGSGKYKIKEIWVEDDTMYFRWTIKRKITEVAGGIVFAVHFVDYGENGEVIYRRSTTNCTALRVLPTTHNDTDYDDDALLYVDINDSELASAVESAVGGVLNG